MILTGRTIRGIIIQCRMRGACIMDIIRIHIIMDTGTTTIIPAAMVVAMDMEVNAGQTVRYY
jgi:hypothetical protein